MSVNGQTCVFCGRPAVARRPGESGNIIVAVCPRCSVEELPALIAEAALASGKGSDNFTTLQKSIEAAQKNYWLVTASMLHARSTGNA
jgi:hypothetical protein